MEYERYPNNVDPNEITQFLNTYRSGNAPRGRDYYAPTILSESLQSQRAPRASTRYTESSAGQTVLSSAFDQDDGQSYYSVSTYPPTTGTWPHQPVPATDFYHYSEPEPVAQVLLPCEFDQITGCDMQFPLGDQENWIAHHAEHLNYNFPMHCLCWFCERGIYTARSDSPKDRERSFQKRMRHIANHIRNGTSDHIQIDQDFMAHVYTIGLINPNQYNDSTDCYQSSSVHPSGWRPPQAESGEEEVARNRPHKHKSSKEKDHGHRSSKDKGRESKSTKDKRHHRGQ